jgi:hypothetical protein
VTVQAAPTSADEVLDRLTNDFEFFCRTCLKVPDKNTLRPIPLVFKPAQRRLAKILIEDLIAGTPIRIIILKARRHGMSTIVQAFFFWRCTTRHYQHSLTIAHDQTTTGYLHGITERYFRHMPRWCRPMKDSSTRGSILEFQNPTKQEHLRDKEPGLESSMRTTSLENAGAGFGILYLHLSEVARQPWCSDKGSEALTTALQTVPLEQGTAVIIESTAQGVGNNFHEMWLAAESEESDYAAFFAPWWEEPTYASKAPVDFERTSEEAEVAELAQRSTWAPWALSDDQLQWRRLCIANECRGRIDQFNQEYPATPREAFLTSGRPYFDLESVERHREHTELGKPRHTGDLVARTVGSQLVATFEPTKYGNLRIWEEPQEGMDYLIFSDCAAGTGDKGDFQAAYVMPRDKMEIVAAWHGLVDRDLFADNLCRLGYLYNRALIAVEVTGGWGASVITSLRKDNYPMIYRKRPSGDRKDRKRQMIYGWETTQKTRAEMLDCLEQALRDDDIVCNDSQLLEECRTFVIRNGKPQAQQGCKDDRVMAASGLVYLWLHEPGSYRQRRTVESEPWVPTSLTAGY